MNKMKGYPREIITRELRTHRFSCPNFNGR